MCENRGRRKQKGIARVHACACAAAVCMRIKFGEKQFEDETSLE